MAIGNRVFITWDADNMSDIVNQHSENENVGGLSDASAKIDQGNSIFKQFAEQHGGQIVSIGGDSGVIGFEGELNSEDLQPALEQLRQLYSQIVGTTVSVGVGRSLSQASKALLAAKGQGKDQTLIYSNDIEQGSQEVSDPNIDMPEEEQVMGDNVDVDEVEPHDDFQDAIQSPEGQEEDEAQESEEQGPELYGQENYVPNPAEEMQDGYSPETEDQNGEGFEAEPGYSNEDGEGDLFEPNVDENGDQYTQDYSQEEEDQDGYEPSELPNGPDGATYDDDIAVGDNLQGSFPEADGGYDQNETDQYGDQPLDEFQDESTEDEPQDDQGYVDQDGNEESEFENEPGLELEGNTDVEDGMDDVEPMEDEEQGMPEGEEQVDETYIPHEGDGEDFEEAPVNGDETEEDLGDDGVEVDEDGVPVEFAAPEDGEEAQLEDGSEEMPVEGSPEEDDEEDEAQAFHEMLNEENGRLVEKMKAQVSQTLESFKQVKDQLEMVKNQTPELFQATVGMLDTLLTLSKALFGPYSDEGESDGNEEAGADLPFPNTPKQVEIAGQPTLESPPVKKQ